MQEFGVNGPTYDAVAKKLWLASVNVLLQFRECLPDDSAPGPASCLSRGGCTSLAAFCSKPIAGLARLVARRCRNLARDRRMI